MSYGQRRKGRPTAKRPDFPDSSPVVEIVDDRVLLDDSDWRALTRAFRPTTDGDYTPRSAISHKVLKPVTKRLCAHAPGAGSTCPYPPAPAAGRVWQGRQWGWQVDDVASSSGLNGSNIDSRKTQAITAYKDAEAFRLACELAGCLWWFGSGSLVPGSPLRVMNMRSRKTGNESI